MIKRIAPIRFYRGYRIYLPNKDRGRPVLYNFRTVNYHLPRRFLWLGGGDEELNSYVDSLVERRMLEARRFEEAGLAVEHTYAEAPKDNPTVTIQPEMLVAIILGEIPIDCPIDTVLKFRCSPSGRYVPDRIIAELASHGIIDAYYAGLPQYIETGRPIALHEHLEGIEVRKNAKTIEGTLGINLHEAEKQGKGTRAEVTQAPQAPVVEEMVDTIVLPNGGTEVISVVLSEPQYFVKRRYATDGTRLQAATAWTAEGPWVTS